MRISDWSSDVCSSDLKTATWQGWENDRAEPRSNKLLMIAGAFGVSPTWLLGGYGDGPTEVIEDEVQILRQELQSVAQDVAAAQTRLDAVLSRLETFHTRSEEPTSELQSLMRISYAVFCLKKNQQPS